MVEKIEKTESFLMKGSGGTGIILFHGWTSPPDELRPLAEYLNSFGYTVHAPLLRGHGTKPEDLFDVVWRDWLEDARNALADMEKEATNIFVGGMSIGGDLALLLSENESVRGVFTLGAPIKFRFHRIVKATLFLMGLWKQYRRKYYLPWIRVEAEKRNTYPYYPVKNAREVIRLAEITRNFLPKIAKPLLIAQSTKDHLVSRRTPKIIQKKTKSSMKEIFWVENSYHVFVENRKVWEKIREFVSRI